MPDWIDYEEARGDAPHTVVGTVKVLAGVRSLELGNERELLVYLPPSYPLGRATYPVLYMQDGQNLFDEETSYAGEWHVDETMEELAREGLEAIVVGVPNATVARFHEYGPFHEPGMGGGRADAYLRFLTGTVKPLVDAEFRTAPERERTGVLGSSLGGLVSLYAFFERPDVFGLCGAMSPSLHFGRGAAMTYLASRPYVPGRIYLDVGSLEGQPPRLGRLVFSRLPRGYPRRVREAQRFLIAKGYRPGWDLMYREEKGGGHNEAAWGRRLPQALRFLLGAPAMSPQPPGH